MIPPDEGREDYRLVVRRLFFAERGTEAKVVMNLGSNFVRYAVNRGYAFC